MTIKHFTDNLIVMRNCAEGDTTVATIITSLPHTTNDGQSTFLARATFFATLRANGVKFTFETPCTGFWYSDEGKLYEQECTLVTMHGSEGAMRAAVGAFGYTVGDLEMLFVEKTSGDKYIQAVASGHKGAAALAKDFGGATLLPDGYAISLRYASLVAGVDYPATNVVR